ncbi:MAG: hypothetical protein RLY86_653 [Pseudomonadota bacterium]|jgi:hypothetical protein
MTLSSPLAGGPEPAGHRYSLNGLILHATRPLPFLVPAAPGVQAGPPDVRVEFGPVQPPPPSPELTQVGRSITLAADGTAWVRAGDWGHIQVRAGREIRVDAPAAVPDAHIHTWLCGGALSILSHQRGLAPLHACVVTIGGRAVALAGHSGAGKSTTAAALLRRGHGLVTDDQAVIDPKSGLVAPGYPSIKLWGSAAAALGYPTDDRLRIGTGDDKFHAPFRNQFVTEVVPLVAVVVVRADEAVASPSIRALPWPQSLAVLHRLVHWRTIGDHIDGGRAALSIMGGIARSIPVVTLTRPVDMSHLDDLADRVERLAMEVPFPVRGS